MTTSPPVVPPMPRTALEKVRWTLVDGRVIAGQGFVHWVRNPTVVVSVLLYPIVVVLLFGYVLGSAMVVAGGGDYREYLMPGIFAQTMVFGVAATMAAVSSDVAKGVSDRFRAMPISQAGVVVGRSFADMVNSVIELAILVGCGLVVGWGWNEGPGRALAAAGLLLLLRFALIWVGIYVGLHIAPEAAGASWMLLMPLTFLANTFVSPSQLPAWLGAIAAWNPLSATVGATRELFGNPGVGGDSWAAQHPVLLAVAWPVAIIAVFLPLAARRYRRLDR
ncbi:ABC transporter permease [Spirillospora sp. NPDC048911]|uniref:ABC transporter permease n=1 Tax=Spirillospora sp. NPDC048911 TaxID=3364527 RepID=UPI003710CA56